MSSKETRQLQDFLIIVQRGIRKHGINTIVKTIQAIDLQENNLFYNDILNFIFISVEEDFHISREDLVGRNKRGIVTLARKVAIILSTTHLNISDEQLAKQFNRVRQVVYNIRMEHKEFSRESKIDEMFFERYDSINEKVVKYIEQLKE